MIYPSPNGFNEGIHKWSVKCIANGWLNGLRSIGVTTVISEEWISKGVGNNKWPKDDKQGSYLDGFRKWYDNQTIEVILNLNVFIVEYYLIKEKDGSSERIKLKQDKLTENDQDKYYFALCIDSDYSSFVFEYIDQIKV